MADSTFHFGKYKGTPLADIPEAYLEWVIINHGDNTLHSIMCVQCDFSQSDIKPVDGQFFFCSAVAVPRVFSKVAKLSRVSSGKLDS